MKQILECKDCGKEIVYETEDGVIIAGSRQGKTTDVYLDCEHCGETNKYKVQIED